MDLTTFGEAIIDLPSIKPGVGLADAPGFAKVAAGAPANVAVAAVRLGLSAAFVTKVGDDAFGDAIIETFGGYGVDTSHIVKDATARTGLAFVAIAADGEREFLFYFDPAHDLALRSDEIESSLLAGTRAFHYGSISMIAQPARDTTLRAARLAHEAGALVTYDPNLRPRLWPDTATMRREASAGFAEAHVTKIGSDELRFLLPDAESDATAVQALFDQHPRLQLVTVTSGAQGSVGYLRGVDGVAAAGYPVTPLDATGAGDAFMGGLLVTLLRCGATREDILSNIADVLPHALAYANACGAYATTQLGATVHLLTDDAIADLMKGPQSPHIDRS